MTNTPLTDALNKLIGDAGTLATTLDAIDFMAQGDLQFTDPRGNRHEPTDQVAALLHMAAVATRSLLDDAEKCFAMAVAEKTGRV